MATFAIAAVLALRAEPPNVYTLVAGDGSRHQLAFRPSGDTDLVPLEDLATLFPITVREDTSSGGGVTLVVRGQRIVLTTGKSLASAGGRLVSLSGPLTRDGRTWLVPVDLLSRAIGPALGTRIDVRRPSRFIVVGDAKVPQVLARIERASSNGRLTIDAQPAVGHRVTRDGSRITIRFDADALDFAPASGAAPEFVSAVRVDDKSLVVDLGPLATTFRVTEDRDPTRFVIDLLAPGASPTPARPALQEPPAIEVTQSAGVRTVVIDPGHGGEDAGVKGAAGTIEKDLTLQIARRLKAGIESRIGLRVLLTREGDDTVDADKRTAFANNNRADLFLSLHANASLRSDARGAQVLTLALDDYKRRGQTSTTGGNVPVVGGTMRAIEAVPWDLAQIPFAAKSLALGAVVARHLNEQGVPLYRRPTDQVPLRILAGANMPAVLVEVGFLSNADDEKALMGDEAINAIVNALVDAILDARGGAMSLAGGGGRR